MGTKSDFDCILLCEGSTDRKMLESYLKYKFNCTLLKDKIKVSWYKSSPYFADVMSYKNSELHTPYRIAVCAVKGCPYFKNVIVDLLDEIKNETLHFKRIFVLTDNDSNEETEDRLKNIVCKINEKASNEITYGFDCIGKWKSFFVKKCCGDINVNLSFCYQTIPEDKQGCIESLAFDNCLFDPDFCKKYLIDNKKEKEKDNFLSEWPKSQDVIKYFVEEQLNNLKYLSKRQNKIKAKFAVALSVIDPRNYRIDVSEIYDYMIKDDNEKLNRILEPLSVMLNERQLTN